MDPKIEEKLNGLEQHFRELLASSEAVQRKLKEQVAKYQALAKQTEAFLRTFEFYGEGEAPRPQLFWEVSGPGFEQALESLDRAIQLYSDIVYFFKRKRSFYRKYKNMKVKNLNQQTGGGDVTVNNQKDPLSQLEQHILDHNSSLVAFLDKSPLIKAAHVDVVRSVELAAEKIDALGA